MEGASAPLITDYISSSANGRSRRRRRRNNNMSNSRSWWIFSCSLILMSFTLPFFIPFFFLASCLGLLLLMPLGSAFLLIFISWHKLIQVIMQTSSLGQYDQSLYEPIKEALVSQLARIAEWAEQKAGHMLYIAGPDNFDQYMMNRPIDDDGDGDGEDAESYVSTEHCHGEKNGRRRMVSENRNNYMGSRSRDNHMISKRRRNFDKDLMLGNHATDRDENALVCHDGHGDDVMYWYNPLGSIFNSRDHYLNGNVSEENVAECGIRDDDDALYLDNENLTTISSLMIQKISGHSNESDDDDDDDDDDDQKMLYIQDLYDATRNTSNYVGDNGGHGNVNGISYTLDPQRSKSLCRRRLNGGHHDPKHELLNTASVFNQMSSNGVEEKHEILSYPSEVACSKDMKFREHVKNIRHKPQTGPLDHDNAVAVMDRSVKPSTVKLDYKICVNKPLHSPSSGSATQKSTRCASNESYKKAPTLTVPESSPCSFSSDGSPSPSSRPTLMKTMVSASRDGSLSNPRKQSPTDSNLSKPTAKMNVNLNNIKARNISKSPCSSYSQSTVFRKETNNRNVDMRRELFPTKDASNGNTRASTSYHNNGSLEEPILKSPNRSSNHRNVNDMMQEFPVTKDTSYSIARVSPRPSFQNNCLLEEHIEKSPNCSSSNSIMKHTHGRASNTSANESASTCNMSLKYRGKCSMPNKSTTNNKSPQAFGRSTASSSLAGQANVNGAKKSSSIIASLGERDNFTKNISESSSRSHVHTLGIKRVSASHSPHVGFHEAEEPELMHEEHQDVKSSSACTQGSSSSDRCEDVLNPCTSRNLEEALKRRYASSLSSKISTSELEEVWRRIVVQHGGNLSKHGNSQLSDPKTIDDLGCGSSTNGRTFFGPLEFFQLLEFWRTADHQQDSIRKRTSQSPSTQDV